MSPQSCKVCLHGSRLVIEEKIMRNIPHTQIAKEHKVSNQSIRYHSIHHLPEKLLKSERVKEVMHSNSMFDNIMELVNKTKVILDRAEAKGKSYLSLTAIRELRSTYELMVRISAYLHEQKDKDADLKRQLEDLENLSDEELDLMEKLLLKGMGEDIDIAIPREPWESRNKFKRRGKVELDFEDEKKEETGEDDGDN